MREWRRILGVGAVVGAGVALLALPSRPGEGAGTGNQVIIIASASVRGEISPCG